MIGEAAGLGAAICWAWGSMLFEGLDSPLRKRPTAMTTATCVIAGSVLGITWMLMEGPGAFALAAPRTWGVLAASAWIGITLGDSCFFLCLAHSGAARAVLMLSLAPVVTVVLESISQGRLPGAQVLAGMALTIVGIALAVIKPRSLAEKNPEASRKPWLGIVAGLGAAICQGSAALMSRGAMTDHVSPLGAGSFRLVCSAIALIAFATLRKEWGILAQEYRRPPVWKRLVGATLIGTVAGIWLQQVALEKSASAAIATTLLSTSPIFAVPLAHLWGIEKARPRAVSGVLCAFAGVVLLTSAQTGG